ncbi:MAG: TRAP transporter large permease [Candidatus Methylomirabilales bacterium]
MILLLFALLAVLILANAPISLALGLASTVAAAVQAKGPLLFIPQKIFTSLDSFPLLAVPLFILAGSFLETGGVGRRLVHLVNVLVRHLPGGLGMVVVLATMVFSEISGSSAADAAAIGSVTIPAMLRLGYTPAFATAIVAAAGGAAVLIPPSIAAVIYGWQANTSVGALFAAGFIPGFATALALIVYIYVTARRQRFPVEAKASWPETGRALVEALPALLMPVIILGGIFAGLFTATESAAVAVFYGVGVALLYYREIGWRDIPAILVESAVITGIVGLLLGMASVFGWVLTTLQIPLKLANAILAVSGSLWVFLLLVNLLLLVAGCFLNATAILVVIVPILIPMAERFGMDLVHFGIMVIANLGIGYVTPPVGTCLYVACSISKAPMDKVIRPLIPLLLVMVAMLLVVAFAPGLTLLVPRLLYGK